MKLNFKRGLKMFKLKCFAVFYLVLIVGFFVAVDAKKLMTNVKVNQGGKQSYLQDDLYKALVSGEKDIETKVVWADSLVAGVGVYTVSTDIRARRIFGYDSLTTASFKASGTSRTNKLYCTDSLTAGNITNSTSNITTATITTARITNITTADSINLGISAFTTFNADTHAKRIVGVTTTALTLPSMYLTNIYISVRDSLNCSSVAKIYVIANTDTIFNKLSTDSLKSGTYNAVLPIKKIGGAVKVKVYGDSLISGRIKIYFKGDKY
jgi:hypothetical protein